MAHFPPNPHSICIGERMVCHKSINFSIIPVLSKALVPGCEHRRL
jgi:hypothetical protein